MVHTAGSMFSRWPSTSTGWGTKAEWLVSTSLTPSADVSIPSPATSGFRCSTMRVPRRGAWSSAHSAMVYVPLPSLDQCSGGPSEEREKTSTLSATMNAL